MEFYIHPNKIEKYLGDIALIDVRSPKEFSVGHIPGAYNIPLFTDDERAEVGTLYKQHSKESAILKGLDFVGPKMTTYIHQLKQVTRDKKAMLYCWRGGQRSQSLAWLFQKVGYEIKVIEGGYKAYRNYKMKSLDETELKLIVLGGRTGTGKTYILKELEKQGEQILDLESLANHKGSAFGHLGEDIQPSTEMFNNLLLQSIGKLDTSKRIWVENESKGIGTVYLQDVFWNKMKQAPLINISTPFSLRVDHLVADYASHEKRELIDAFYKIEKRIGGKDLKNAVNAIESGNYPTAAEIALHYYDKTYQYNLEQNSSPNIKLLDFKSIDFKQIATSLIQQADATYKR